MTLREFIEITDTYENYYFICDRLNNINFFISGDEGEKSMQRDLKKFGNRKVLHFSINDLNSYEINI